MRRTKEQIAADAVAAAKVDKQHNRVRELLGTIKSAHHARNRGLVVQQAAQLHQLAVALLEHQTSAAKTAVASEPPPVDDEAEAEHQAELAAVSL